MLRRLIVPMPGCAVNWSAIGDARSITTGLPPSCGCNSRGKWAGTASQESQFGSSLDDLIAEEWVGRGEWPWHLENCNRVRFS